MAKSSPASSLNTASPDNGPFGIGLMLCAYFLFSFVDAGAKWLGVLGLAAIQLAFMRYFVHFVISSGVMMLPKKPDQNKGKQNKAQHYTAPRLADFKSPHIGLALLRGLLLMGSTVMNFIAVRYLPLTLTSTILFSAPIMICFLSWPLLGEKVGWLRMSAILLGFIGVIVAIRPLGESFHWAMSLSLMAALGFALYSILTRKLAGKVPVDLLQFYSGMIGSLILLPFAFWQWQNPETLLDWGVLLSLGFFAWFGHQLLTHAHGFAPANLLMPFGYSFIIFLTLWSAILFNEYPDIWTIAGAVIIVVSGLIIWFRERQLQKSPPVL